VRIRRRVVNHGRRRSIDTVFSDGRVKKWGGELVAADYAQLAREVRHRARTCSSDSAGVATDEMRAGH